MSVNYKAIDLMKFVCSILIVVLHTNPFGDLGVSFLVNQNITRIAVPLFFITSGYLFWGKYKENKSYVYKYVKNIFKINLIWTLIYLPYNIYSNRNSGMSIIEEILLYVKGFFFYGTYGQLWYLSAIIISILLIIFLYRYLSLKQIGLVGVVFYIIGLLGDSYFGLFDSRIKDLIINSYSLVFEYSRNGFLFATIFITIGMLIKEYGWNFKVEKRKNIIFVIITFLLLLVETHTIRRFGIARDYSMMISLLVLTPLIFTLVLNTTRFKSIKNAKIFRSLSLWIYCVHEVFSIIADGLLDISGMSYFIFVLGGSIITYFIFEKIKVIFKQKVLVSK